MEITAFEDLSDFIFPCFHPELILAIDPGWKLGYAIFGDGLFLEYGTMNFQKEVGERDASMLCVIFSGICLCDIPFRYF